MKCLMVSLTIPYPIPTIIIKNTENTRLYNSIKKVLRVHSMAFNNIVFKRFIRKYQFFFVGPVFCAALRLFSAEGLLLCGGGVVWFLGGYFEGLRLNQDILFSP